MSDVDYGWFADVARKLGKNEFAREIETAKPQKHHSEFYSSDNLVTFKGDREENEE